MARTINGNNSPIALFIIPIGTIYIIYWSTNRT